MLAGMAGLATKLTVFSGYGMVWQLVWILSVASLFLSVSLSFPAVQAAQEQ